MLTALPGPIALMPNPPRQPADAEAAETTARILLETKAVLFSPDKPFTFTSGRVSPVYIDCRKLISFPRARRKLMDMGVALIERAVGFESIDAVAGGETAGIPFAAWIAERMALPMLYIRKKPKGFWRNAQIEGELAEGQRVLLVEASSPPSNPSSTIPTNGRHRQEPRRPGFRIESGGPLYSGSGSAKTRQVVVAWA